MCLITNLNPPPHLNNREPKPTFYVDDCEERFKVRWTHPSQYSQVTCTPIFSFLAPWKQKEFTLLMKAEPFIEAVLE
jgi:hypothetical protein